MADAIAALHAFLNIMIFDHPQLHNLLTTVSQEAKTMGLG